MSAVAESDPFKWRHSQGEIILLYVRRYPRYAISYRDLEEMMNERGLSLDHTTIYRRVQAYAPELEKRNGSLRTLRLCAFARNSPTRSEFSQRRKGAKFAKVFL